MITNIDMIQRLDMSTEEIKQSSLNIFLHLRRKVLADRATTGTTILSDSQVIRVVEEIHAVKVFICWYRTAGKKGSRRDSGSGQPLPNVLFVQIISRYPVVERISEIGQKLQTFGQ